MLALSFHSIFEGMALGLLIGPSAYDLMLAIFLHKFAEAMSLSISLTRAFPGQFKFLFWLMFMFSFATPLGISIGLILSTASELVSITFTSLAGGTFLYISCSEVIVEEFSLPGNRWIKFFAYVFGATVITLLWFLDKG